MSIEQHLKNIAAELKRANDYREFGVKPCDLADVLDENPPTFEESYTVTPTIGSPVEPHKVTPTEPVVEVEVEVKTEKELRAALVSAVIAYNEVMGQEPTKALMVKQGHKTPSSVPKDDLIRVTEVFLRNTEMAKRG